MQIGFRVTIRAGPRTKTVVEASSFSVNPKTIRFANGEEISSTNIETWLEEQLQLAIENVKYKPGATR